MIKEKDKTFLIRYIQLNIILWQTLVNSMSQVKTYWFVVTAHQFLFVGIPVLSFLCFVRFGQTVHTKKALKDTFKSFNSLIFIFQLQLSKLEADWYYKWHPFSWTPKRLRKKNNNYMSTSCEDEFIKKEERKWRKIWGEWIRGNFLFVMFLVFEEFTKGYIRLLFRICFNSILS